MHALVICTCMFVCTIDRQYVSIVAFLDELRRYAMDLHTKEQAPAEGKAEAPRDQKPVRMYVHV